MPRAVADADVTLLLQQHAAFDLVDRRGPRPDSCSTPAVCSPRVNASSGSSDGGLRAVHVLVMTVVHHPEDARILHRQIRALVDAGHEVTYAAPVHRARASCPILGERRRPAPGGRA